MAGCTYIGKDQDPQRGPVTYCGHKTLEGKAYCHEHYYVVYQKGTAVVGRRKEKAIEAEIAELAARQQEEMSYE